MIDSIRRQFVKILRDCADKIDAGNSEIDEEQALKVMSIIAHEPVSMEVASQELNMSRTKFNNLIDAGKLPKGKKVRGWKEKRWYLDELKIFKVIK